METNKQLKIGEKGVWFSIFAYLVLSLAKITVGVFGDSASLLADGFNNATDVIASVAVLVGLKIARKPPDDNHPYGHYRAETMASLVAAFILITVGLQVFLEGIKSLLWTTNEAPDLLTAWVALASALLMLLVYLYNDRLGKKTNSSSLQALAKDNLSDALVSAGVFIGIMGSQFGWHRIDTAFALIIGLLIVQTAVGIFKKAALELTDGFDTEALEDIRKSLDRHPSIHKIKSLKARSHGNQTFVDMVVVLDKHLNVHDSHAITEDIETCLMETHLIRHVHIHIEPN